MTSLSEELNLEPGNPKSGFFQRKKLIFYLIFYVLGMVALVCLIGGLVVFDVVTKNVGTTFDEHEGLLTQTRSDVFSDDVLTCGYGRRLWYSSSDDIGLFVMPTAGWMKTMKKVIKDKPMTQIKIPATHNSATYNINLNQNYSIDAQLDPSKAVLLQVESVFRAYSIDTSNLKRFLVPWFKNQDCTVFEQLIHGIRHLDLRVCVVPSETLPENRYWICHGLLSVPVVDVLDQVKGFLKRTESNEEIVSLDFNHIYGFTSTDHLKFLSMVNTRLGNSTMIDPSKRSLSSTYGDLMKDTGRVFVFYTHLNSVVDHGALLRVFMSSALKTEWAENAKTMDLLKTSLLTQLESRVDMNRGFVTQAVITPDMNMMVSGLFTSPSSSAELSKNSYDVLADWVRDLLPREKTNYINTDYYNFHPKFIANILMSNLRNGKIILQVRAIEKSTL